MPWSSYSCNDSRYSYLTRNTYNRCVENFKILFGASSEACSAIVTTIWRPGLKSYPSQNMFATMLQTVFRQNFLSSQKHSQPCFFNRNRQNPIRRSLGLRYWGWFPTFFRMTTNQQRCQTTGQYPQIPSNAV